MDAINKLDIETAFRGKLWTYTAVINQHGYGLGIAVANEAGYSPVPFSFTAMECDSYKNAEAMADRLNAERGQGRRESLDIVASSMAQSNRAKYGEAEVTDSDQLD